MKIYKLKNAKVTILNLAAILKIQKIIFQSHFYLTVNCIAISANLKTLVVDNLSLTALTTVRRLNLFLTLRKFLANFNLICCAFMYIWFLSFLQIFPSRN